jgi:hypothetical protein
MYYKIYRIGTKWIAEIPDYDYAECTTLDIAAQFIEWWLHI